MERDKLPVKKVISSLVRLMNLIQKSEGLIAFCAMRHTVLKSFDSSHRSPFYPQFS